MAQTIMIDADTYATIDVERSEVSFERFGLGGKVHALTSCPKDYEMPKGYRLVAPPQRWSQPTTAWVV